MSHEPLRAQAFYDPLSGRTAVFLDDAIAYAEAATPSTPEPFDYAAHNRAVDDIVAEVVATPSTPGLDAERLAAGINAALTIRLIAGNTDQRYTPTEVATMVAEIVDEQSARLRAET